MDPVYSVYVIELSDDIGPRQRPDKPCVYIGQTAHSPEERFDQHRRGHKAARCVQKYGVRLRTRLYQAWNPIPTREEALSAEVRLAARLERRGFTVFGDH